MTITHEELDRELLRASLELGIHDDDWVAAQAFMAPLKHKSGVAQVHYYHAVRVALLCRRIGAFVHLDEKALFLAGLLHDLGKCQVPLETLGKTSTWEARDYARIRKHVVDGYAFLRGRFDFTAEVILWHHRFQQGGYPRRMPRRLHQYSEGTKLLIVECGRMLAVADVYDALHRANSKFGELRALSGAEIREKMLALNVDRRRLIEDLYHAGILVAE